MYKEWVTWKWSRPGEKWRTSKLAQKWMKLGGNVPLTMLRMSCKFGQNILITTRVINVLSH